MKTKIYLLWTALLLSTTVFAQTSGTCGENLTWKYEASTATLTISGTGEMTDYGYGGAPWYYSCGNRISKVVINYGVTSIGSCTFWWCENLTSVSIPESITNIGDEAFFSCVKLTSIVIPESVTSIGNRTFESCKKLASIIIPGNVTSIGDDAFRDCTALTSVSIGNGIKSIGERAFRDCFILASVSISESITNIGNSAFYGTRWYNNQQDGCVYINKVLYSYKGTMSENTIIEIQNGTVSITGGAFDGCTGLNSISIPESVTNIGKGAFSGCTRLTSIAIPDNVISIEGGVYTSDGVFSGCTALASIIIPENVASIGNYAFYNCTTLTSIIIPKNVISIGDRALERCSNLALIEVASTNLVYSSEEGVMYNKEKTELIRCPEGKPGSCTISESVTGIGSYAFFGCSRLTSIEVVSTNLVYSSEEGVMYNKEKTELLRCPGGKSGGCSIPEGVTSIKNEAFYGCSSLTSISISNRVADIGSFAFYGCSSLTVISNYNPTPQSISSTHFLGLTISNIALIVPFGSGKLYKNTNIWKEFKIAEDGVSIETAENSAVVSWPVLEDTESYTLHLYRDAAHQVKLGEYHLDKKGNLLRSAATEETMSFTIPGLSANTDYYYELISLDAEENILRSSSESFKTNVVTGIKDAAKTCKDIVVYPNPTAGMIYIETEDNIKVYDSRGVLLQETFGKQADLSNCPDGLYFIKAGNRTAKVIKK